MGLYISRLDCHLNPSKLRADLLKTSSVMELAGSSWQAVLEKKISFLQLSADTASPLA